MSNYYFILDRTNAEHMLNKYGLCVGGVFRIYLTCVRKYKDRFTHNPYVPYLLKIHRGYMFHIVKYTIFSMCGLYI